MREKFSLRLFLIVALMHILALGGLLYFSWEAFFWYLAAHTFFALFGISLGLHKFFSHKYYESNSKIFTAFIAIVSTLCFEGGPLFWSAAHRIHHRDTGRRGDAYSATRGFWWSHMGWMFFINPNGFNYVSSRRLVNDLAKNRFFFWLEQNATTLNIFSLMLGLISAVAFDRIDMFFWLGPVRIVSVWHATWLINSYLHGVFPFYNRNTESKQYYINSYLMSFILGGEGFHRNHHEDPTNPFNSESILGFDFGGWVLIAFEKIGLVNIKRPLWMRTTNSGKLSEPTLD